MAPTFTVTNGVVNTIQGISTTASPSFKGLSVTGSATGASPALTVNTGAGNTSGIHIDTSAGGSGNVIEIHSPYYGGLTSFALDDAGDLTLGGKGANGLGGATGWLGLYDTYGDHTINFSPAHTTADRTLLLPDANGTFCLQYSVSVALPAAAAAATTFRTRTVPPRLPITA